MAIHILCPHCNSPFVLPDELANQLFTCTNCEGLIQLPPAPPPPLPPLEMFETYEEVVGEKPPLLLDILGIFTGWRWDSSIGDVLRFIWSLRYIACLILIILYTLKESASTPQAIYAAPRFFGLLIVFLLWGYLEAVWIARKKDLAEGDPPKIWIASLIINPIALLASDFRDTLPAYRAWALAILLCFSCLCLSITAGSLKYLIPASMRESIDATLHPPHAPPVVISDAPATTAAAETAPASAPATSPATAPASPPTTNPAYRPEDGPPPPPTDP